tara:strand:+ start:28984 stop:29469 length:486 start_codon:yes stop_codon:yes gene_type:complete
MLLAKIYMDIKEKYSKSQAKKAKSLVKIFSKLQASTFVLTNGKLLNKWPGGYPIMVVSMKGAKSNKRRLIPLIHVHKDNYPILVASMGGMPNNPSWYYNLKKNPNISIYTKGNVKNYIAREVSKEEKSDLWPLICSFYPDYETYQSNTSREIPVFLCGDEN